MRDKPKKKTQSELREDITQKIVAALKSGGLPPWRLPYRTDPNAGFPTNIISNNRYRGVNLLLLQATAMSRGYKSKWWGTYEQFRGMGAQVKSRPASFTKGDWGTRIVFYTPVEKEDQERQDRFFVLRSFVVFNVDQVDGDHLSMFRCCNEEELEDRMLARLNYDHVDEVVAATRAKIVTTPLLDDVPSYNAAIDTIGMPKKSRFVDLRSYYGFLFHQLIRWTERRLGWPGKIDYGKDREPMARLIAEIGACYLESELNIPHSEDMSNHNAYISRWINILQGNHRRVFEASSQAMKAVDHILSYSRAA